MHLKVQVHWGEVRKRKHKYYFTIVTNIITVQIIVQRTKRVSFHCELLRL